jgi:hypothetical protein
MAMTREQQEAILHEARAELGEAQAELSAAQRRVVNLQQVIRGLSGLLNPDAEDEQPRFTFDNSALLPANIARRQRDAHVRELARQATLEELQHLTDRDVRVNRAATPTATGQSSKSADTPEEATLVDSRMDTTEDQASAKAPRPRSAIVGVMKSTPNVPMQPREVVQMVRDAGLFNGSLKSGANSYTTALIRLAEDPNSPIMRSPNGLYTYLDPHPAADAIAVESEAGADMD